VGPEALLRGAARIQPDFILADLAILNDPGALRRIKQVSRDSRVLGLVDSKSEPYEDSSRRLGLDGIIEKAHVEQAILDEMAALNRDGDDDNDRIS
jgi:DNA-binding NarL/FixJ family response regulator